MECVCLCAALVYANLVWRVKIFCLVIDREIFLYIDARKYDDKSQNVTIRRN